MTTEAESYELKISSDMASYAFDTTPKVIARELLAVAALLRLGWCKFANAQNAQDESVEISDPDAVKFDLNAALAIVTNSVTVREKLPDLVGPQPHVAPLIQIGLSDGYLSQGHHMREIQEAKDSLTYAIRDDRVNEIDELQHEYYRKKLNALEVINDSISDFSILEKLIERAADSLATE